MVSAVGKLAGAASSLAIVLALGLAQSANASSPLQLTSDGSLGDVTFFNSGFLNTDNSAVYYTSNTGVAIFDHYVASSVVSQAGGPDVRVFNFSSLTINANNSLTIFGSMPAALVATGDFNINGSIIVDSNKLAAGGDSQDGLGPTGGEVGSGHGRYVGDPCCGYDHSSGGGGGGNASAGQQGEAGSLFVGFGPNGAGGLGGAASLQTGILHGGGGGAGGVWGTDYYGYTAGGAGGAGGGAVLFETPGNITIGALGSVTANGDRGFDPNGGTGGAGGGGAGGDIWFDAGQTWTNYGVISATGGAGGHGAVFDPVTNKLTSVSDGGFGAGGQILIDPQAIYNFGLIDLSDGGGGDGLGGHLTLVAPLIVNQGAIQGVAVSPTPEPGTWALMLLGVGAAGAALRRRRIVLAL